MDKKTRMAREEDQIQDLKRQTIDREFDWENMEMYKLDEAQ